MKPRMHLLALLVVLLIAVVDGAFAQATASTSLRPLNLAIRPTDSEKKLMQEYDQAIDRVETKGARTLLENAIKQDPNSVFLRYRLAEHQKKYEAWKMAELLSLQSELLRRLVGENASLVPAVAADMAETCLAMSKDKFEANAIAEAVPYLILNAVLLDPEVDFPREFYPIALHVLRNDELPKESAPHVGKALHVTAAAILAQPDKSRRAKAAEILSKTHAADLDSYLATGKFDSWPTSAKTYFDLLVCVYQERLDRMDIPDPAALRDLQRLVDTMVALTPADALAEGVKQSETLPPIVATQDEYNKRKAMSPTDEMRDSLALVSNYGGVNNRFYEVWLYDENATLRAGDKPFADAMRAHLQQTVKDLAAPILDPNVDADEDTKALQATVLSNLKLIIFIQLHLPDMMKNAGIDGAFADVALGTVHEYGSDALYNNLEDQVANARPATAPFLYRAIPMLGSDNVSKKWINALGRLETRLQPPGTKTALRPTIPVNAGSQGSVDELGRRMGGE